jgi:hypothetical protein
MLKLSHMGAEAMRQIEKEVFYILFGYTPRTWVGSNDYL